MVRSYYNNIIVALLIIEDYLINLKRLFEILKIININLGLLKSFIGFLNVIILGKKIDFFNLNTIPEKFNTIKRLYFLLILKDLKYFLNFISYLRNNIL